MRKTTTIISIILLAAFLLGCQPNWQISLKSNDEEVGVIEPDVLRFYIDGIDDGTESITVARILFHYGFNLVDQIELIDQKDNHYVYDWNDIHDTALIDKNRKVTIENKIIKPKIINVVPSPLAAEITWSIMDIAPTIAQVIGLPPMPGAHGQSRSNSRAGHGVLIFVDGLQNRRLLSLIDQGLLPFFKSVGEIHKSFTVYPSITTSSTAALLTSTPPYVNGVFGYGFRKTETKTIFDHALENGRSVVAVEGSGLAFNLRNADINLNGDRDGDGFTNDNVHKSTLEVIEAGMPDLLFIHFHDVDDQGHQYGPDSQEYADAIIQVDGYLSEIVSVLPSDTFIIIFSDHGMQKDPLGPGGNHGYLTKESMINTIILLEKSED